MAYRIPAFKLDGRALVYYAVIKEFAHIAGVYAMEDWMMIDGRAERFRPLLNDEYGNLKRGAMAITVGLDTLEMPRAPDSGPTVISALVNMQTGIRLARSQARRLINERVLQ